MSTHIEKDGTVRQDHYGSGRQPWDDIKEMGWAPAFAGGNVLKYLRRTKDREHSIESAKWYFQRLVEMRRDGSNNAGTVLYQLSRILTSEEYTLVRGFTTRTEPEDPT